MAKNSGIGFRKGAVKQRSQVETPKSGSYTKRESRAGEFVDAKSNGKPFKGVRKESTEKK